MDYIVFLAFAFVGMQLVNVLINFVFRQKMPNRCTASYSTLSVLIPARNEEANIGKLLQCLLVEQNQKLEIIVCNDHSTDRTQQIIDGFAQLDSRIRSFHSEPLPQGWLGKNHACYQLAQHAKGDFLLFLDSDVVLDASVLTDSVSYLKKYKLGLLSVFPKQILITAGEKLSVPLMNYILLTLLPLVFVRVSPFVSHAAANGQFMLFDASIYKLQQPHEYFKASAVEDIAIARHYKEEKIRMACITGESRIKCRMYKSYNESLLGFSKNIFLFFGNSILVAYLFWFLASFGIVAIAFFETQFMLTYIALIFLIQLFYASVAKQNVLATVLSFPAHLVFMFRVMGKAIAFKNKKNYLWKGRNIY